MKILRSNFCWWYNKNLKKSILIISASFFANKEKSRKSWKSAYPGKNQGGLPPCKRSTLKKEHHPYSRQRATSSGFIALRRGKEEKPCSSRRSPQGRRRTASFAIFLPIWAKKMAESEGFEPSVPCGTPHFQCGAFDHSTSSPRI